MKTRSLVFATATRYLFPLLLLLSLFLLLRGHNEPGGGFVGGFGVEQARQMLHVDPRVLIGVGLLIAATSGVLGLLKGAPFLTGLWLPNPVPILGKLGTPFLFDVGVYLLVVGVVLQIVFVLSEE